jgi:hypothetical protein
LRYETHWRVEIMTAPNATNDVLRSSYVDDDEPTHPAMECGIGVAVAIVIDDPDADPPTVREPVSHTVVRRRDPNAAA